MTVQTALARRCTEDEIRRAIEETPAVAVTVGLLEKAAIDSIRCETAKVGALSDAGMPGIGTEGVW
ncbi:hypothetical protein AB0K86_08115 [Streptomyces clavifer]|uniref:hypothetical protein n=1 Tax=Streptomyces TaxID=1883 RepID=UPI0006F37EAA|nr:MULTISPECIES: hypothetical protein [unclassified Streptomyces]KQZ03881.1 hypothetical protein ASD51_18905 [Streptomyces sp. Root55]MDX3064472.1 hypothetical protein [Streptomyces sp. ND04-05B]